MILSLQRASPKSYVHYTACEALAAGISIVPIRTDGSKQPALVEWHSYQQRRPDTHESERWFRTGELGIAFVTGKISGHLEALDFDDRPTYERWCLHMQRDPVLAGLYEQVTQGYLESTPAGGRHILYRCESVEGNQKLATRPDGDRRKTLIETRGEGGLIIVAPSRGRVHPSSKSYILLRGAVSSIRTITPSERTLLLNVARALDEMPLHIPPVLSPRWTRTGIVAHPGQRPGDLFNQYASWEEILLPHGWQRVRTVNGESQWRRPGKNTAFGISATTNHQGHDLLYVFSTSTLFEAEHGYTKFHAYTLLNHHGDFSAAARTLAALGYKPEQ